MPKSPPFGILADDLTGATDCAVQFARQGAAVLVLVSMTRLPAELDGAWDVVALNTDSRQLTPEAAQAAVREGLALLQTAGWPVRYKKVDSTLRGNLIAELETALGEGQRGYLAPAFPLSGRTVEQGVLMVEGRPVHETEIGRDAHSPVPEGSLTDLLGGSPHLRPALLPLEVVEAGAEAIESRRAAAFATGHNILVCDANQQAQLALLARALLPDFPESLTIGSAGMARELAPLLLQQAPAIRLPHAGQGAVLVVAGSRNRVTREQVARLARRPGTALHSLQTGTVEGVWDAGRRRQLAEETVASLARHLTDTVDCLAVHLEESEGGGEPGQAFRERSHRLNELLGEIVAMALERFPVRGLVLTGGDIAAAALDALQVRAVRMGPEVLPGIPISWPVEGSHSGLRFATKAGGFGPPDALWQAVERLREQA